MSSPMVSATKDSYFEPWYLLLSYNVPSTSQNIGDFRVEILTQNEFEQAACNLVRIIGP